MISRTVGPPAIPLRPSRRPALEWPRFPCLSEPEGDGYRREGTGPSSFRLDPFQNWNLPPDPLIPGRGERQTIPTASGPSGRSHAPAPPAAKGPRRQSALRSSRAGRRGPRDAPPTRARPVTGPRPESLLRRRVGAALRGSDGGAGRPRVGIAVGRPSLRQGAALRRRPRAPRRAPPRPARVRVSAASAVRREREGGIYSDPRGAGGEVT